MSYPAPPDYVSDHSSLASPNMSGSTLSPTSPPLDWTSVHAMEDNTLQHHFIGEWSSLDIPLTGLGLQVPDVGPWPYALNGSVDLGLRLDLIHGSSPNLSYTSQNDATCRAHSESVPMPLPRELHGMPFPEQGDQVSLTYWSPALTGRTSPEFDYHCIQDPIGPPSSRDPCSDLSYSSPNPLDDVRIGQAPHRDNGGPLPRVAAARPIRPRPDAFECSGQPTYGSQHPLRPHISGSPRLLTSVAKDGDDVGNSPRVNREFFRQGATTGATAGFGASKPVRSRAPVLDSTAVRVNALMHSRNKEEIVGEDWPHSSYKQEPFDFVDKCNKLNARSFPRTGYDPDAIKPLPAIRGRGTRRHINGMVDQPLVGPYQPGRSRQADEVDEARHRTHPWYRLLPGKDGLYRCPYKSAEGCQHKSTKLKCNYEYDASSHLAILLPMGSRADFDSYT